MAIYHCQVKPVSRAKGQSATAGAAYRSCSKIIDERTGETFDFTRKRGLEHSEIVLSSEAAKQDIQWARDRSRLWNAAELSEIRKDARPAREYELGLPHELSKAGRVELARAFAQDIANRNQCAVDIAIHKPHWKGDDRNFHAHLYATTRQITPTGLGAKTYIERSDTDRAKIGLPPGKDEITTIRERWAEAVNKALEAENKQARVDHRSLEAQGIDRAPTRHQGPAIRGLVARGEKSTVLERIKQEDADRRLAKAAEVGRIIAVSKSLRASVLDLSGNVAKARDAREAAAKADIVEKAKQEGLAALKAQQTDRQKPLDQVLGSSAAAGKDEDNPLTKGRGLELAKGAELGMGAGWRKPLTAEEQQAESRARWIDYQAKEKARKQELGDAPDKARQEIIDRMKARARSPEEQQREAAERLREYQERRAKGFEQKPEKGAEKDLERGRGKGKEFDGPEFE